LFGYVGVIPEAYAAQESIGAGAELDAGGARLIDRLGFLSAGLGVIAEPSGLQGEDVVKVGAEIYTGRKKDGSDLRKLDDPFAVVSRGVFTGLGGDGGDGGDGEPQAGEPQCVTAYLDLIGCSRYVKIVPKLEFPEGSGAELLNVSFAAALGDKNINPVDYSGAPDHWDGEHPNLMARNLR
jgi:hypothetical protein